MGHGAKQAAYLDWKVVAAGQHRQHAGRSNAKGAVFADFTPLPELAEIREAVYFGDGKKHLTWEYLKALTPLALAVWYMDDGSFTVRSKGVQERTRGGTGRIEICVEAMSPGSRDRLVQYLRDTHGLEVKLTIRGARQMACSSVHHRSDRRSSRSSSRPTCTRRWSTSCCRGSAAVRCRAAVRRQPPCAWFRRGSWTSTSSRRPAR